jgi:hypothetical protein
MALTFVNPCFGREPKAKVVIKMFKMNDIMVKRAQDK